MLLLCTEDKYSTDCQVKIHIHEFRQSPQEILRNSGIVCCLYCRFQRKQRDILSDTIGSTCERYYLASLCWSNPITFVSSFVNWHPAAFVHPLKEMLSVLMMVLPHRQLHQCLVVPFSYAFSNLISAERLTAGGASTLQRGIVKTMTRGVNLDKSDFSGIMCFSSEDW